MSDIDVKEIRKNLGISQEKLAEMIGVSLRTIQNYEFGGVVPKSKHAILRGIAAGQISIDDNTLSIPKTASAPYIMVPVYNFDAVGGMHADNEIVDAPAYIEKYVPFADAHIDDFCVNVTGNSMIPTYNPGSILLVRKVEGWREYFGYGHTFMIFLRDGRRILKEVRKSCENSKEFVLCVSHNKDYQTEELPKSLILDVYKIIATLNNEGF